MVAAPSSSVGTFAQLFFRDTASFLYQYRELEAYEIKIRDNRFSSEKACLDRQEPLPELSTVASLGE